jgi:NADH dehydrogenase
MKRKIDVRLNTRLESCVDGHVVLSDGEEFDTETIVWTAGVKANPVPVPDRPAAGREGPPALPSRPQGGRRRGRLVRRRRRGGARPHRRPGVTTTPSAQHAVRQAKVLGDNIALVLNGRSPNAYAHKHVGSVASLGLHKGVAQVYGVKLRGFPAWFMHRTYHVSRVPTLNRKVRVILDWTLALFFRRDIVSLGSLQRPREEFSEATR